MIPHAITPGTGDEEAVLRVRCTEEQAALLGRILARTYPTRTPSLLPEVDQQRYTHWCILPESAEHVQRWWPGIQVQLLLAGGATTTRDGMPTLAPAGQPADKSTAPTNEAASGEPAEHTRGRQRRSSTPQSPIGMPRIQGIPTVHLPDRPVPTNQPAAAGKDGALKAELAQLAGLPPASRIAKLEAIYHADDPGLVQAGLMLGEALQAEGRHPRAIAIYEALIATVPSNQRVGVRARHAQALLAADRAGEIPALIPQEEPSPALRGLLGVALARIGRPAEALAHLGYCWQQPDARTPTVALALARIHWQRHEYDAAVAPFTLLIERAPNDMQAADYAAMAELAELGVFGKQSEERQLACIEGFCTYASPAERRDPGVQHLVQRGVELARQTGDASRLFHAYQHALDGLLQRRAGAGGDLLGMIADLALDYHSQRLQGAQRFDLLEEIMSHLRDYPQVLREPLIESFEDLLSDELARASGSAVPFPAYVRDLARALRSLKSRGSVYEAYKQALTARQAGDLVPESDDAAPSGIAGKRIALVGGHDRMRAQVRTRLHAWGASVDEVPPPTSGRTTEREVLDRVRSSDLILLIVSYMGHDMSTIISNLKGRAALRGTVLPVDCRGTSGVSRAIRAWAEAL